MEEVDSIIIHFLRQLNVNINDDVKNICDIPVETIIESAAQCISAINPTLKVPLKLPTGVSQRIGVATQIATICKDLGYKNDVGYQTFLYYNESDLRQVFMFLIEKLPSEDKKSVSKVSPSNKKHLLMQQISYKIAEQLNTIWIPPSCNAPLKKSIGDYIHEQDYLSENKIDEKAIIEKLMKLQSVKPDVQIMAKGNSKEEQIDCMSSENKQEINKSLKELKETTIHLKQKLDTLTSERNVMEVEFSQALKSCERVESDFKNIQNVLNSIGINDIESENGVDNLLEKVHRNINMMHCKVEELTSRNLSLKVDIDKLKSDRALTQSERSKCRKILIDLKEKAKGMKDECENKEELKNQLKTKYEKLKGGNKRHVYTKRILEIIGNVDKQNMEIKKILEDTRQLQKEINTLEGQLGRCFSIADETLFKDAKKDDQAKKAYKLLALLHSECNTIVSLVNETGILARDIVDLEDNIKAEKSKRTEDILQKIQLDLTNLQKESA
ncbi:coiled-coil domain-containing protein 22 homolog [Zerene cesonia]|uniref:coiled-coil domain-containing protein 22 homolog n=1 Tax=Zerene cesonia TaxID=33412 RepID=UPI0018E4EC09|nr:coiled-coil domain-containing protein 22 homolog [Zerene cesonia]